MIRAALAAALLATSCVATAAEPPQPIAWHVTAYCKTEGRFARPLLFKLRFRGFDFVPCKWLHETHSA